jgi:hypothetical protein
VVLIASWMEVMRIEKKEKKRKESELNDADKGD